MVQQQIDTLPRFTRTERGHLHTRDFTHTHTHLHRNAQKLFQTLWGKTLLGLGRGKGKSFSLRETALQFLGKGLIGLEDTQKGGKSNATTTFGVVFSRFWLKFDVWCMGESKRFQPSRAPPGPPPRYSSFWLAPFTLLECRVGLTFFCVQGSKAR